MPHLPAFRFSGQTQAGVIGVGGNAVATLRRAA
jgi:hypothetical protein